MSAERDILVADNLKHFILKERKYSLLLVGNPHLSILRLTRHRVHRLLCMMTE